MHAFYATCVSSIMRTKHTGEQAPPLANGHATALAATSTPEKVSSPARQHSTESARSSLPSRPRTPPLELSDQDKTALAAWLDSTDKPFDVVTEPLSKKRKRNQQDWKVQDDLWEPRLSVRFEVRPRYKWENLRRYNKFTVNNESFSTGQCILVNPDVKATGMDIEDQWKATVLEVKALDSQHVYVRVAWLNRPEDLPAGREAHHGRQELIPTNQMDVIDALTVNGSLEVLHWEDTDDNDTTIDEHQYFWRQTFDVSGTRTLSKLRLICVEPAPQNPDRTILQCSNRDCLKWLHVKCMAETAAKEAQTGKPGRKSLEQHEPDIENLPSSAVEKAVVGQFTSEVFIQGLPDLPDSIPAARNEIVITNTNGEQHAIDLACLHCGERIDD